MEPMPQLVATIQRRVLYLSATITLHVDLSFLLLILPRRVLGVDKSLQIVSAGSFHKHLLNAVWVFGVAGLTPDDIDADDFFLYGTLLPIVVSSAYLVFAVLVKSEKYAQATLRFTGIDPPPESLPNNVAVISKNMLPNITAIPGSWIYSVFKKKPFRALFVLGPIFFSWLARQLLESLPRFLEGPTERCIYLILIAVLSPLLYFLDQGVLLVPQSTKQS